MAVVAVDVGGTSLKAGILDPSGIPALRRVPSQRQRGPDAVLETIASTAASLIEDCAALGLPVDGVGVAANGIVDDDAGVGVLSVNMGWRDLPVRDRLSELLGRPVTVRHDVRAAAVAELTFGAAADVMSALFVPIGTGISAAIILDGVVIPGASFRAGEIGQIIVAPSLTLEDVASARAIAERHAAAAGVSVSSEDVFRLVQDGDPTAGEVWSVAVAHLADVLAGAIAVLDVELLVVGGGLGRAGETLTVPLHAAISERLPWRPAPPVVTARFADDAGFVGAGIEAWKAAGREVGELATALAPRSGGPQSQIRDSGHPDRGVRLRTPRLGSG